MLDVPPEVLASAFELGILTWGISFLPPACLVCRRWNDIIVDTPRLWGIIQVGRGSSKTQLLNQIQRAKSTPLKVYMSRGISRNKQLEPIISALVKLSSNWVSASVPADVLLRRCRWPDLRESLESLEILDGMPVVEESNFFEEDGSHAPTHRHALRSLSVVGPTAGTDHLFTSFLQHLSLSPGRLSTTPAHSTLVQLRKTPNLKTLRISNISHGGNAPQIPIEVVIPLKELTSLEVSLVDSPSYLLASLACPSLETLEIGKTPWLFLPAPLTPFLVAWCSLSGSMPTSLHTLKISRLLPLDIPVLIHFLGRVPKLVHLSLTVEYDYGEPDNDWHEILRALSSPSGAAHGGGEGWMCPQLAILHLDFPELRSKDLMELVVQRGCKSKEGGLPTLRTLRGTLCSEFTEDEKLEMERRLYSFDCQCLACTMDSFAWELINDPLSRTGSRIC